MKLQPELKTAKWIFDCSYLLAFLPSQRRRRRALQKKPSTSDVPEVFNRENGILKLLMPTVVAV